MRTLRRSSIRFSRRQRTAARRRGETLHISSAFSKCLSSRRMGRPRCTSNWVVEPGVGLFQHAFGQVGRDHLQPHRRAALLGQHGEGVGFLARGAAGGPDLDRAVPGRPGEQRQHLAAERLEHRSIAEEGRVGDGQRFGRRARQGLLALLAQARQQGCDGRHALPPGQRPEPVLGEVHLVAAQAQPAAHARQLVQEGEVVRAHSRPAWLNL